MFILHRRLHLIERKKENSIYMEKRYVAGVGDDKKNFKENSKAA